MGGTVLTMNGTKATKQSTPAKKREPNRKFSHFAEDPTAEYLLTSTDERGKTVYFFKVTVTGLKDCIFGPYASRALAVDCFDAVLNAALESFCEVLNTERRNGNHGMEHIALPKDLKPIPCEVRR